MLKAQVHPKQYTFKNYRTNHSGLILKLVYDTDWVIAKRLVDIYRHIK